MHFLLTDAKPVNTPMIPGATYSKKDCPCSPQEAACMSKVPYCEAIGSLMYASIATWPDITFAVLILSQFLENPGEAHWAATKQVFRYLSGTQNLAITYGRDRHSLQGYTDADGFSQEPFYAILGHVFLIDGGAVSWSLQKQELVTLSTVEAEYVAVTHAAKEAIWLRRLIGDLHIPTAIATTLFCDNQAALHLAKTDNYHARTKHIDTRYHFVCDIEKHGKISLAFCPTDDMTADILTKALPSWKIMQHGQALGLGRPCRGVLDSGAPEAV
jgi:hypothetical protein